MREFCREHRGLSSETFKLEWKIENGYLSIKQLYHANIPYSADVQSL